MMSFCLPRLGHPLFPFTDLSALADRALTHTSAAFLIDALPTGIHHSQAAAPASTAPLAQAVPPSPQDRHLHVTTSDLDTRPLMLHFLAEPSANLPFSRLHIDVAEGAHLRLHDHIHGLDSLTVLSLSLAKGARVEHLHTQACDITATALQSTEVYLAEGAQYDCLTIQAGAAQARHETIIHLTGEGAKATLAGIYRTGSGQRHDLTTVVNHHHPGATSQQTIRGLIDHGGRASFQGKINVARHAHGSEAHQHHKALLLAEDARVAAIPELAILTNDVRCSHGCAIGELDPQALLYLASRGLSPAAARQLLTDGFLKEAMTNLPQRLRQDALRGMSTGYNQIPLIFGETDDLFFGDTDAPL
jgi:Fe-S cluster assembly protein SufD